MFLFYFKLCITIILFFPIILGLGIKTFVMLVCLMVMLIFSFHCNIFPLKYLLSSSVWPFLTPAAIYRIWGLLHFVLHLFILCISLLKFQLPRVLMLPNLFLLSVYLLLTMYLELDRNTSSFFWLNIVWFC